MNYETTVADLSPHQLFGLMILAFGFIWAAGQAIRVYPELDGRARIMFWAGMVALLGVPGYLGLTALAPALPNP